MKILSVGEVLWDVFGDVEYLGGAPLNFSVASQRLGDQAALLTAIGNDERGIRALKDIHALGLTTTFVQHVSGHPTGTALVNSDQDRNTVFTIDRPAAFDFLVIDAPTLDRAARFAPDWLYFGTLAQSNPNTDIELIRLVESLPNTKRFYDVNLRTGHWNLSLVKKLSSVADVLKLNQQEAQLLFELTHQHSTYDLEAFCHHWSSAYNISTICVTLGNNGCVIFTDNALSFFEGFRVEVVDTVGAGDAFAAAFLHGLSAGWPVEKNATFANALGALVVGRPGATTDWTIEEVYALARSRSVSTDAANASARQGL